MMASDIRTNGKGWAGLILVVGLIGAGFLYQREGGRLFPNLAGAPDGHVAPDSSDTQSKIGTNSRNDSKDSIGQATADVQSGGIASPPDNPANNGTRTKTTSTTQDTRNGLARDGNLTNSNPLRPARTTPGAVAVVTRFVSERVAQYDTGKRAGGPWLYVNGVLKRDFTQEPMKYAQGPQPAPLGDGRDWFEFRETLSLQPGSYLMESVVEGYEPIGSGVFIKDDVFALQVQSRRIQVEADKSVEFVAEFPMPFIVAKLDPLQGTGGVPNNFDTWLRDFTERADQNLKLFDIDPLVSALKEADKALGNGPPPKPVTMVKLPEKYGGQRELTAIQVRLIVEWLKRKYWGDWTDAETLRINASIRPNAEANTRQINRLDTVVKEHRGIIEQLNSLARKLDQSRMP